jgi:mannose-1-phosphate guanylyltransferase
MSRMKSQWPEEAFRSLDGSDGADAVPRKPSGGEPSKAPTAFLLEMVARLERLSEHVDDYLAIPHRARRASAGARGRSCSARPASCSAASRASRRDVLTGGAGGTISAAPRTAATRIMTTDAARIERDHPGGGARLPRGEIANGARAGQGDEEREHLWAVVLAAGNGSRVSGLTSGPAGVAVPKQYCRFGRATCMLRWALDRAATVLPRERVLTVVAEEHRAFWDSELTDLPPGNVIVQPRNRGTAAGILLPVLEVLLRRDSRSRVLIMPSDHYVTDEAVLRRALRKALGLPRRADGRLVVLGMTPTSDDPEYGWILPTPPRGGALREVAGFVEKPDSQTARDLAAAGALLNTMIFVADGSVLLRLYEEALPNLLHPFLRLLRDGVEARALEGFYETLPVSDFSREVLERSSRHLSVLPVPDCGWSDLGTPARIQSFLGRERRLSRDSTGADAWAGSAR